MEVIETAKKIPHPKQGRMSPGHRTHVIDPTTEALFNELGHASARLQAWCGGIFGAYPRAKHGERMAAWRGHVR